MDKKQTLIDRIINKKLAGEADNQSTCWGKCACDGCGDGWTDHRPEHWKSKCNGQPRCIADLCGSGPTIPV